MSSRNSTILSFCTLVLPWFTAPFLGKNVFRRFTSVAIVTNVIWSILSVFANKKRWWKADPFILKNVPIDIPFVAGMYFITILWVFKLTFGNFIRYFALNAVIDFLLAFPVVKFYDQVGAFKLRKMSSTLFYMIVLSLAIIIYVYQCTMERVMNWMKGKRVHPVMGEVSD
ncbi:hypothetical protein [Rossellomorea aquimaris]|uniref:hypothetical protein n=1 Tax=Rossellomorea aquimaris TaxID=189382 RepID=UPI0005C93173|nr:hypothetical protein [Rossellomorea aquimaris]